MRPDPPPKDSYDLRRITAFRISILSNRLTLWSARVFAREFEISVLEWRVIAPLGALGAATASQIADMTMLDKGNVSRTVRGLVERGLIERTAHSSDRRKRILSLTRRGKKLHDMVAVRSRSRETQLFENFSEAKREQFLALLAELDVRALTLLKAETR